MWYLPVAPEEALIQYIEYRRSQGASTIRDVFRSCSALALTAETQDKATNSRGSADARLIDLCSPAFWAGEIAGLADVGFWPWKRQLLHSKNMQIEYYWCTRIASLLGQGAHEPQQSIVEARSARRAPGVTL
jgi:hypothetical protein